MGMCLKAQCKIGGTTLEMPVVWGRSAGKDACTERQVHGKTPAWRDAHTDGVCLQGRTHAWRAGR